MKLSLREFFSPQLINESGPDGLNEYEDPTSSKRSQDDSKWAGPGAAEERMPHEEPQDDAQENSAEGWEEVRADGPDSGSCEKVHDFFGGSPYPKSSSHRSSRKMSEAKDDDEFLKGLTGSNKKSSIEDIGNIDQSDITGMGRKQPPGENTTPYGDDDPADLAQSSEKGEDLSDDDLEFLKSLTDLKPAPKSSATEPPPAEEPDWGSMDDEEMVSKLAAGPAPELPSYGQPKMRDTIKTDDEPSYASADQQMGWDELRASNPDEAAELEQRYPEDIEQTKFKKKKSGFLHATLPDGRRMFYMGDDRGWQDMDDGGSPSGEF